MFQEALFRGLSAFAIAALLLWLLEPVAFRIGLVDRPGGRKSHEKPTPLVGGIAMFVAFSFVILTLPVPLSSYRPLFAGALLLVVVGVLDDLRELSARMRFAAQVSASLMMALWAGVALQDLGHIGWGGALVGLGILSVPLTVFATVGVINAVNMSDGIDGLAGSLCLVTVSSLAVLAWEGGDGPALALLALLGSVILAFLTFNMRLHTRALVFMGDSGSMFLGFVLAWFLVMFSQGEHRLIEPVVALWIFALPLMDTVSMMSRRILGGRSPFEADRGHFHHILQSAGLSSRQTLGIMLLLAAAAAGVGLAGHFLRVPSQWMFIGFLVLFGAHFWVVMRAWRVKRFLAWWMLHRSESGVGG